MSNALIIKSYFLRGLKKVSNVLNKDFYYTNKYGFKQIVSLKTFRPYAVPEDAKRQYINTDEFYLSFDGLRDEYTFVGTSVKESPHYKLIEACSGGSLDNCEYLKLEKHGKLDARDTIIYSEKFHIDAFIKAYSSMKSNDTKPVLYYVIDGKKYIFDGKHRIALYSYYNKPVPAVEIPLSSQKTPYVMAFHKKICKNPNTFVKQRKIIEEIINS